MAFTYLHTVVEGSQSLGLVVLREGSAQTVVPFVPLRAGAVGTGWVNHIAVDLPGTLCVAVSSCLAASGLSLAQCPSPSLPREPRAA